MKAVVLPQHGGPEVLEIADIPEPEPGPEEILVDVVATALNRADLLQRLGLYPGPPTDYEVPGLEFAGHVAAVGDRVTLWQIGDEVMGIVGGGAYAERLAVHERQVMAVPQSVDVADAAAIPEVWITAFDALVAQGGLTSGGRALVHTGASGVGTAGIQICTAVGAQVAVTCSAGKVPACEELGASLVVDYTSQDFVAEVREWAGSPGIDVVLDVIGGDYVDRNVDVVRVGGTIVQVGVMEDAVTTINVAKWLPKRVHLIGTVLRARPLEEKIAITRRFTDEMLWVFDAGQGRPIIDSRFALADIADAHRRMESNANIGKILVDVG